MELKSLGKTLYLEEDCGNGIIKVAPFIGKDIYEVIKEATEYIAKHKEIKKIELVELNGTDITIDRKTTYASALESYELTTKENAQKHNEEYEEWKKALAKERKQEREEREAFVYHNVDEALLALTEVTPCDLSSSDPTRTEALTFCKEIMTIVLKCSGLHFNDTQKKEMSEILKTLGATGYKDVNEKFISERKIPGIPTIDIKLPLDLFSNVIDATPEYFDHAFARGTEGGLRHSKIGVWLAEQKEKEKTRNQ